MLKTIEDVSATKKRLRIEIPGDVIEREIAQALGRLRQRVRIPGYRPGKVPTALLEKRFGKEIESEAMEKILPEYYANAIKEADITPISGPVLEEAVDFKRNAPLSMTFLVEVRPRIEDLRYEGIRVTEIPVSVEDRDVEETLKRLQEQKAVYEPSEEAVEAGDLVTMDYEIKEEGARHADQVFKVGSDPMPPEFSEKFLGMKKGEETEFELTLPEDFQAAEMAGKRYTFKVSLKDVKKARTPAVDDDLAKDVGFDDLEALRKHIRESILQSKGETVRRIMKAEALKKIVESHEFEPPESLVEEELARIVDEAAAKGRKDAREVLMEEYRPAALRHVKATLLMQAIGEKEKLETTEDELKARVQGLAERMHLTPENVMKYFISRDGSLDGLRHSIFEEKVLDLILDRAEIVKSESEKGD
ncbi:MAG: trigger factor [Thermodesulfovibrionales bacterium]